MWALKPSVLGMLNSYRWTLPRYQKLQFHLHDLLCVCLIINRVWKFPCSPFPTSHIKNLISVYLSLVVLGSYVLLLKKPPSPEMLSHRVWVHVIKLVSFGWLFSCDKVKLSYFSFKVVLNTFASGSFGLGLYMTNKNVFLSISNVYKSAFPRFYPNSFI